MNITYSILWFDDTAEWFEGQDLSPITDQIESWGFEPDIRLVTNPDEFMSLVPFNQFDLIVVDFNLQAYDKHGDEFIQKIRENSVFTEVVFYSAQAASELWRAVSKRQLEGVFVANRNNVIQKIIDVSHQTVRKVLDLENMRGIVMAEVGDLDLLLDEIIRKGATSITEDERETIHKKFHKDFKEQLNSSLKRAEEFLAAPTTESMLDLCDTMKRWNNFNRIKKVHSTIKDLEIGDYDNDVIHPRNFLAHGIPSPRAEGGFLFKFRGREFIYQDDTGIKLRQKIVEYRKTFSEILKSI